MSGTQGNIEKTRKAFIYLKQPPKEEILWFKDSLNRGLSTTSFKYLECFEDPLKGPIFGGHLSKRGEEPGTELVRQTWRKRTTFFHKVIRLSAVASLKL